jgi:RNA polymerase sigma-70 factor (ECF subfamily)
MARVGKATAELDAPGTSDPELMRQLAAGQIGALGELYDRHHKALRSFIGRVTRDAHDVDDLVHATFLAVAQSADRYDGRSSCRPWLIGTAAQLLRRRQRALGRLLKVLSALRGSLPPARDPCPALQARSDVERALAGLSEPKRVTLLMAEVEGLSCEEIARALDIPIGTVWTRLHAARRELRRAIAGEGTGES